jgi:tellurite resistance protein TehA-like permease
VILYWVGALIALLVLFPVVVYLLRGVHDAARAITPSVGRISAAAAAGSKDLDAVPLLLTTQEQVKRTVEVVADYGGSLDTIVDDV